MSERPNGGLALFWRTPKGVWTYDWAKLGADASEIPEGEVREALVEYAAEKRCQLLEGQRPVPPRVDASEQEHADWDALNVRWQEALAASRLHLWAHAVATYAPDSPAWGSAADIFQVVVAGLNGMDKPVPISLPGRVR